MAYNQDSVSIVCVSSNRSLPRAGARDIHLFSSPVSSQSTDLPNSRLMASSTAPPGSFAVSKEERLVYRSSPVEEIGQIAGIRNGRLRQEPEAVQVLRLTEKQMAKRKEKGEGDKSPPLLTSEVAYSPAIAPKSNRHSQSPSGSGHQPRVRQVGRLATDRGGEEIIRPAPSASAGHIETGCETTSWRESKRRRSSKTVVLLQMRCRNLLGRIAGVSQSRPALSVISREFGRMFDWLRTREEKELVGNDTHRVAPKRVARLGPAQRSR
jgi:hypothetical protein